MAKKPYTTKKCSRCEGIFFEYEFTLGKEGFRCDWCNPCWRKANPRNPSFRVHNKYLKEINKHYEE